MMIEEAKKELENRIIHTPGVIGIGTMLDDGEKYIEVSVLNEGVANTVRQELSHEKWHGHPVKIIIRNQSKVL
jgi:hypothetical protein